MPALVLAAGFVIADVGTRDEVRDRTETDTEVSAVVLRGSPVYDGWSVVRFADPDGGGQVEVEVTTDEPVGSTVTVLVDRDNPAAAEVTEVVTASGSPAQMWIYAVWVVPWFVWWGVRWWTVRRTARTVRASTRTYRLWGTLSPVRARSGLGVVLFALDAEAGDRPLCAIPLIAPPVVVHDGRVEVEVKGVPRAGGFLVPLVNGSVGWPAGRAVPARYPHLDHEDSPRPRPWVPALLTALVLGILVADAAISEIRLKQNADAVQEHGEPVTGEITEVIDALTLGVQFTAPGSEKTTVATTVEAAETASYQVGDPIELLVDPDDPIAARIEGEPYDFSWLIGVVVTWAIVVGVVYAIAASRVRRRPGHPR